MNKWLIATIIVIIILAGGFYLIKQNYASPSLGGSSPTTIPSPENPSSPAVEVIVSGTEFAFDPPIITVKKGQTIKVTFKNNGTFPHNFAISDLNVTTKIISPGEQDSIQFTANQEGQFNFLCTIGGHADKGMKGTLIVQP